MKHEWITKKQKQPQSPAKHLNKTKMNALLIFFYLYTSNMRLELFFLFFYVLYVKLLGNKHRHLFFFLFFFPSFFVLFLLMMISCSLIELKKKTFENLYTHLQLGVCDCVFAVLSFCGYFWIAHFSLCLKEKLRNANSAIRMFQPKAANKSHKSPISALCIRCVPISLPL